MSFDFPCKSGNPYYLLLLTYQLGNITIYGAEFHKPLNEEAMQ